MKVPGSSPPRKPSPVVAVTSAASPRSRLILPLSLLCVLLVFSISERQNVTAASQLAPVPAGTVAGTLGVRTPVTVSAPGPSGAMRHVWVVGCGHSGTSILKRTIAHLPGMHCVPKESQLFSNKASSPADRRRQMAKWDAAAAAAGFEGWVEKTPKHVEQLEAIWRTDPESRVVFVVRDARDVAASMAQRGVTVSDALRRWIADNSRVLPFLADPRLLAVRFEDFVDEGGVLSVLRRLSTFLGLPATDSRLLLALQPAAAMLQAGHQCAEYDSEQHKVANLTASYLQLLAGREAAVKGAAPSRAVYHNAFRSWQASQAWAPHKGSAWRQRLDCNQQKEVAASVEARQLLERFGYAWEDAGGGRSCQDELGAAQGATSR